jgi:predicted transcriptional regulator of viral defense system
MYIIDILGGAVRYREWDTKLYDIAETQLGYFTADQSRRAGIRPIKLVQLARDGEIERVSRGIYRLNRYPASPLGQYMAAALWPQVRRPGAFAVISHASALTLYEMSDVSPAKVHITLPPSIRIRRAIPGSYVVHQAALPAEDVMTVEGIPVTTPQRTIRDVHAAHLGTALVRQAIEDGRRNGRLSYNLAAQLQHELLGEPPTEPGGVDRDRVLGSVGVR